MITHLYIRNYALISELSLPFEAGFSSITGETGAGKSILLGAMGLALGERADLKSISDQSEKCVVELTVNLGAYQLQPLFEELDLDYAEETILRREILPSGKSRAFVNDTPARVSDLNSVAVRLIDIHSQNDTLMLRDVAFQLSLVDYMANNSDVKTAYKTAFDSWKTAQKQLEDLKSEVIGDTDLDYQRFLLEELLDARLESEDEEELIEEELHRLQHAEEVAEAMGSADRLMSDEEGVLSQLERLIHSMTSASKYDARVAELLERVRSVEIEMNDVQSELESIAQLSDFDPERLGVLDERMSTFQHLKAKHRVQTLGELISTREELDRRMDLFSNMEAKLKEAEAEVDSKHAELKDAGSVLTQSRLAILPTIQDEIGSMLTELNMPNARVLMEMSLAERPSASGYDQIEWKFSANKGKDAQLLHKAASGGELSRVMLALKSIMSASKNLPTIIFDEIDTGISGETAKRVATILKRMGLKMQVLAITHLPQIAAAGQSHYLVAKREINGVTQTNIRKLTDEERVEEVSRIISGDSTSEASRANAQELLASE